MQESNWLYFFPRVFFENVLYHLLLIHSSIQVFQIMCIYLPVGCEKIRVKFIIFSQVTIRERCSKPMERNEDQIY